MCSMGSVVGMMEKAKARTETALMQERMKELDELENLVRALKICFKTMGNYSDTDNLDWLDNAAKNQINQMRHIENGLMLICHMVRLAIWERLNKDTEHPQTPREWIDEMETEHKYLELGAHYGQKGY